MSEHLVGRIKRLFGKGQYANRWFAGLIQTKDGDVVKLSGIASTQVAVGMMVECEAEYTEHQTYGGSWSPVKGTLITRVLTSRQDVVQFLSSSLFPGVGRKTAEDLYDLYHADTIVSLKDPVLLQKAAVVCKLRKNQVEVLFAGLHVEAGVMELLKYFPHMRPETAQRLLEKDPHLKVDEFVKLTNRECGYEFLIMTNHLPMVQADEIMLEDVGADPTGWPRLEMIVYLAMKSFLNDRNATYVRLYDPDSASHSEEWTMFFLEYVLRVKLYQLLPEVVQGVSLTAMNFLRLIHDRDPKEWRMLHLTGLRDDADGRKEACLYMSSMYEAEQRLAVMLARAYMEQNPVLAVRTQNLKPWLRNFRQTSGAGYTDEQLLGVIGAFQHRISFLTGGPGCGKTQTIEALLKAWQDVVHGEILLLAPTGRAVNRVKSQTGYADAETVMRFLTMNIGWNERGFIDSFGHMINNELSTLIVVDESSMLCFQDAARLLQMVKECTVVFVGDADQLAPIDPGPFWDECLRSQRVFVTELTQNFRTRSSAAARVLNHNARAVIDGSSLKDLNLLNEAFQVIAAEEQPSGTDVLSQAEQFVLDIYMDHLRQGADYSDILMIAPFTSSRYRLSTSHLNQMLQDQVNPEREVKFAKLGMDDFGKFFDARGVWTGVVDMNGLRIRIGDRVMNTHNSMDMEWHTFKDDHLWYNDDLLDPKDGSNSGLFNGDAGVVVRAYLGSDSRNMTVVVALDDNRPEAEKLADPQPTRYVYWISEADGNRPSCLKHCCLGYALTVHKAQGSEAAHVIVALSEQGYMACKFREDHGGMPFMTKNMLHTAITRAKEDVAIVGSLKALEGCMRTEYRCTNINLAKALRDYTV